jgi:hypothetical protein
MKKLIRLFVFAALVTTLALPALAQTTPTASTTTTAGAQDDPAVKAADYEQFTKNIKASPAVAYEAGKAYLAKYEAKDGPDDQYIKYIKNWVGKYEKIARRQQLLQQIIDKKYNDAFALSKQVLVDFPDDTEVLYRLVSAGFIAADNKDETNNADTIAYAKKLIPLVQAGKNPNSSKSKEEVLGDLNYAIGTLSQKTQPAEAATYFINAAQYGGSSKKDPKTYLYLADIYEKGQYATLAKQYSASCKTEDQAKTPECTELKGKVDQVVDHIIDALARAVAYNDASPNAAANAPARAAWMDALTKYYKYRNNDSDTGLKELIASITSKPLPKPDETIAPLTPKATTTPSSSATPTTQPNGTATGTPAGKTVTTPATTTPAKAGTTPASKTPAGSKTTTTQPTGKTSTTKTTPRRSHK